MPLSIVNFSISVHYVRKWMEECTSCAVDLFHWPWLLQDGIKNVLEQGPKHDHSAVVFN